MSTYEVIAIRYATLTSTLGELYYRHHAYGEPDGEAVMDYFLYLLRSEERTILIDTGYAPAAGAKRGRTTLIEPLQALAELGVDEAALDRLVITHLHYDHIGNVAAFPSTPLVVDARELEFWSGPYAHHVQFSGSTEDDELATIFAAQRAGRVTAVGPDEEIAPGVRAIRVGGHSAGQQILIVQSAGGPVLLTSDAVHFYDELERERPFAVLHDLEACYRAFDTIRTLTAQLDAVLVVGHDPAVTDRFAPVDGPGAAFAHRIA